MSDVIQKKKRLSPFSQEFWVAKGMSPEEADFKRNSIRPIRPEYWLVRGHSHEESEILAKQKKDSNNKKGAKASGNLPKEIRCIKSPRRVEYWMNLGFSEEDAKEKVSEVQSTFSLEKCIEKHGTEKGYLVWKERQDSWQASLKSKSEEEILSINSKKNCILPKGSIEETIEFYKKSRNITLVATKEELIEMFRLKIKEKPNLQYYKPSKFLEVFCPKIQLTILNLDFEELKDSITHLFKDSSYYIKNKKNAYRKWVDEGLLRSSYEIYFYERYKELFPEIELGLDNNYPNSSFRYDFVCFGDHIEICPMYYSDAKYRAKMDKKKELFNPVFLKTTKEIDEYLEKKYESYNR